MIVPSHYFLFFSAKDPFFHKETRCIPYKNVHRTMSHQFYLSNETRNTAIEKVYIMLPNFSFFGILEMYFEDCLGNQPKQGRV